MNFKADDSLFTSSQNNVLRTRHKRDDDGSTVRTRPRTTDVHTVRQSGLKLLEVPAENGTAFN